MIPKPRSSQKRVVSCILGIAAVGWVGETELDDATIDTGAFAISIVEATNPGYTSENLTLNSS